MTDSACSCFRRYDGIPILVASCPLHGTLLADPPVTTNDDDDQARLQPTPPSNARGTTSHG